VPCLDRSAGRVSVEGSGEETVGQTAVIQKSERWVAVNTIESQTLRGPFFSGAYRPARGDAVRTPPSKLIDRVVEQRPGIGRSTSALRNKSAD
jgi:hypothetical protein